MANTEHGSFPQPSDKGLTLWRYMDFTKFVGLLATKKLFLCRADRFEDPFEGSYPIANIRLRPQVYTDKEDLEKHVPEISNFVKWLRQWTYVTCWHANEHESAAMWKLYAQLSDAVAIETDYQTLASVLPESAYLGLVTYIDYEKEWLPEGNVFAPFMYKRKSFEHEREVRAIIQQMPFADTGSGGKRLTQEQQNSSPGIEVDVDVARLVKRVHVSPTASPWFRDLVETTSTQFGFNFNVKKSDLYSQPVF